MKLNHSTLRRLLPLFLMFLVLFEVSAYVSMAPRLQAGFFELYVLGPNKTPSAYYPNNSPLIEAGTSLSWYLGVSNRMGTLQLVDIRVKLGNSTINPPNDTMGYASSAPLVLDFKQFMVNNETWQFPFLWQVLNFTTSQGGSSPILRLRIGNATFVLTNTPICTSSSSCQFRFIFELWTWNVDQNDFQIGWWNGDQHRIAWLQVWFTVTPGAH